MNRNIQLLVIMSVCLLSAFSQPAIAQLSANHPLVQPKPGNSVNAQVKPAITLSPGFVQVEEAGAIARSSPNLGEAARRMKQRGLPATVSLVSLRSVFRKPDRETSQAMRAASYLDAELLDAVQQLDKPAAAALVAKAREIGASVDATALYLLKLSPNLEFDALFALVQPLDHFAKAFIATVSAKAPSVEQIVSTGARYHKSRQFALSDNHFFPQPDMIAELVRARHPSTKQLDIWSRMLLAGYEPSLIWKQIPIGEFAGNGLARDPVAVCVAQNFTATEPNGTRRFVEHVVPIAIALDGSGSPDSGKASCYAQFFQLMRVRTISRANAKQVLQSAVVCVPDQAPTCGSLKASAVESILQSAGYPQEKS